MKVFVYGTLKRGYGNHRLLENATLIDEAVFESDTGLPLTGEVYQVDAATLQSLDNLEGEGTMYFRKEVPVSLANSHDRSVVAMYIGNPEFWSWPQPNHNDRFTKDNVLNWSR
jgi:gamma-glutamylcyclotransferase (GGCT)/AIG2-like uncharacterized protein YtfP